MSVVWCERYPKQAISAVFESGSADDLHRTGSLLMDAPKCNSFSELARLAGDHPAWDELVRALEQDITRARHRAVA